ncbi:MAG: tRNA 2-thiocytidine biosynthesis TtcA family protein [Candidatus Aenigmatarchaeota archaeon]
MKCRWCGQKAVIEIPHSRLSLCKGCFFEYFGKQVEKAIDQFGMFDRKSRILVAVSGGKDSLSLWDILIRKGYNAVGLHINLKIGEYSEKSLEATKNFAHANGLELIVADAPEEGVNHVSERLRRNPCSVCGIVKRYIFNKVAVENGFDVLATGHNLDDEASRLMGNILHWQEDMLRRQSPLLEATHPKLIKKVRPLFRLTEREIAAYAFMRGIKYIIDECPLSEGATTLIYKEILNNLESRMPGTKHAFYFGFLRRKDNERGGEVLKECSSCGYPTISELCSYCSIMKRVAILKG